jgi:hypothetical protein
MESLNAQKMGSGAQAFDFLEEKKGGGGGGAGEFADRGFTQDQMQLLEDTETVRKLFQNLLHCFHTLFRRWSI